jgi:hypothetical protein
VQIIGRDKGTFKFLSKSTIDDFDSCGPPSDVYPSILKQQQQYLFIQTNNILANKNKK